MLSSVPTRLAALVAAVLLGAVPLRAAGQETPLTADEFEAYATGRTLFYNSGGKAYGAEQYLPGRKVVWAFVGDDCLKGEWHAEGEFICFTYEDRADQQCWTFYHSATGLTARFRGDPTGQPLVAVEQSPEPMACMGPDVGV